jgi:hypothetical protein
MLNMSVFVVYAEYTFLMASSTHRDCLADIHCTVIVSFTSPEAVKTLMQVVALVNSVPTNACHRAVGVIGDGWLSLELLLVLLFVSGVAGWLVVHGAVCSLCHWSWCI